MDQTSIDQAIWQSIRLGPNDRGALIGKTGSGKTTLARFLVEDPRKPWSVSWNPKNSDAIKEWTNQTEVSSLRALMDSDDQRLIYTPDPFHAEDEYTQTEFFTWIYERKNTRLYIDEATQIKYGGTRIPRFLNAVLNRGRERGISTLTATQRPASIPMNVLSESEHFYIFKVLLPQDRARIEAVTGLTVEDQVSLEDFEFFYFNVSRGLLPRKIKLNLRGARGHSEPTGTERESTGAAIAV
jgi:hypothetical protein